MDSGPSMLDRLPPEIRLKIYGLLGYPVLMNQLAFVDRFMTANISVRDQYRFLDATGEHAHRKVSDYAGLRTVYPDFCPSLLRVNRAISVDLYSLLYTGTMTSFLFDVSSAKPLFLSTRALSFLTHVTVGPTYQYNAVKSYDEARVTALAKSIKFVCHNCPYIQVLGMHIVAGDFLRIPVGGHEDIYRALSDAANNYKSIQRLIIGLGKYPYESIELSSLPGVETGKEVREWVRTVFGQIRPMIEGAYSKKEG